MQVNSYNDFFPIVNTTVIRDLQMVESKDAESWIRRNR